MNGGVGGSQGHSSRSTRTHPHMRTDLWEKPNTSTGNNTCPSPPHDPTGHVSTQVPSARAMVLFSPSSAQVTPLVGLFRGCRLRGERASVCFVHG